MVLVTQLFAQQSRWQTEISRGVLLGSAFRAVLMVGFSLQMYTFSKEMLSIVRSPRFLATNIMQKWGTKKMVWARAKSWGDRLWLMFQHVAEWYPSICWFKPGICRGSGRHERGVVVVCRSQLGSFSFCCIPYLAVGYCWARLSWPIMKQPLSNHSPSIDLG